MTAAVLSATPAMSYVVTCRLGCSGFTFTLRDKPSRKPLDGDMTELKRDMLDDGFATIQ